MDIPMIPDFGNAVLQAQRPAINGVMVTSADILSAKNFEIAQLSAAYTSAQATHAEVQAWRLYLIDLDHCRC
jgi:hypothetical protein